MKSENIEKAAKYLTGILTRETSIKFSRFYNDLTTSDAGNAQLLAQIGVVPTPEQENEYGSDACAFGLIEQAFIQLWDQHVLTRNESTDTLIDGESDYEICFSVNGRKKFDSGFRPTFHRPREV